MEFDRLVVGFLVDEVVGGFFISVPPGHIACVYDRGRGVLPRIWGPGLHLKIPFWQVAKLFNAQILEYAIRRGFDISDNKEALGDEPVVTQTADNQIIAVEGSVLFRINKHSAPALWENLGENVVSKVVRPISRSRIAAIFSQMTVDQIRFNRNSIENHIKDELSQHFTDKGLNCEGFLLSEVRVVNPKGQDAVLIQEDTKIHANDVGDGQPILNH
jgi:regulator of protease activity HflC (stomatin/prohibitin superfamily)